ncbi:GTP cyclohydrolase [Apiospora arundinis]
MVEFAETSSDKKLEEHSSGNSAVSPSDADDSTQGKKSSRKSRHKKRKNDSTTANGTVENSEQHAHAGKRKNSLSQAARDPRDEPEGKKKKKRRKESKDGSKAIEEVPFTRSPTPVIDFDGLSRPTRGTRQRLEESPEDAAKRLERMQGAVRTILECVGEDPDREGVLATPKRYAEALLYFTKGYQENIKDIVNNAIFHEGHNEMVIVKDIEIFSMCEHHMVPFTGKMHIGYIPNNNVIGISKLPRIAEMFSRRLQVQERLTREVANAIMEVLQPQGVGVVMESAHLCMVMRGVQKTSATTITSCVLGCFENREKTRNEFLSLIGLNR